MISLQNIRLLFRTTLVTTPILMGVMFWHGARLRTPTTPRGIIDAELADTLTRAHEILSAWKSIVPHAIINTYIDFGFLLSYALSLFAGVWLLGSKLQGFLHFIGKPLAYAMLLAGLLDAIENCLMLQTFSGKVYETILVATAMSARVKFFLVFLGLAYLILAGIYFLIVRTRLRHSNAKQPI